MFYIGLAVGIFIGAFIGITIAGLCYASRQSERDQSFAEMHKKSYGEDLDTSEESCTGWKYPDECPHDGNFDPYSSICEECEKDARNALKEAYGG